MELVHIQLELHVSMKIKKCIIIMSIGNLVALKLFAASDCSLRCSSFWSHGCFMLLVHLLDLELQVYLRFTQYLHLSCHSYQIG